jgi:hypothetical protein
MKQWLIVLGIVGVLTTGTIVTVMKDRATALARQSAESPTIGLVATPVRWSACTRWRLIICRAREEKGGHTLTFSFVDGANVVHTHTVERVTWYDPANTYKVCYDPRDPNDWKLYTSEHACRRKEVGERR